MFPCCHACISPCRDNKNWVLCYVDSLRKGWGRVSEGPLNGHAGLIFRQLRWQCIINIRPLVHKSRHLGEIWCTELTLHSLYTLCCNFTSKCYEVLPLTAWEKPMCHCDAEACEQFCKFLAITSGYDKPSGLILRMILWTWSCEHDAYLHNINLCLSNGS